MSTVRRDLVRVWAVALVLILLGGCASLPTHGPVVEREPDRQEQLPVATGIDARPPTAGATRSEIVAGFLDAMTSWPIQTSVAKQYLAAGAAGRWNPEKSTLVYGESLPPRETGSTVTVQLTRADRLDAVGAWTGAVPESDLTVSFDLVIENGEYRIANPPDGLLVPSSWFQQRYRQMSLYYFDPAGTTLVPEPVFVPVGDQLATRLVDSLINGPPVRARGVVRTFLPTGDGAGLSVPVNGEGVAEVTLGGDAPRLSADGADRMLAQLAWTLHQDPDITAIRVTMGGEEMPLPGGVAQYSVEEAQQYDAVEAAGSPQLFGLSAGRLVGDSQGDLGPVSGVFGDQDAGLDAVTVRPDDQRAAVVDAGGHRVRIGPVQEENDSPAPRTLLSGGTYARPTWDTAGRLWILDRRAGRAVVWLVEDDRPPRPVRVPGFTGAAARSLTVSRDGTRLLGVVRTKHGDEVRSARVVLGGRGRVLRARTPVVVRRAQATRIIDLAWVADTRVALLTATAPGSLYEVDVVSADGAAVGVDTLATVVTGKVIGLTAAPTEGAPMLAVYEDSYTDLASGDEESAGRATPLSQLDYVG